MLINVAFGLRQAEQSAADTTPEYKRGFEHEARLCAVVQGHRISISKSPFCLGDMEFPARLQVRS